MPNFTIHLEVSKTIPQKRLMHGFSTLDKRRNTIKYTPYVISNPIRSLSALNWCATWGIGEWDDFRILSLVRIIAPNP